MSATPEQLADALACLARMPGHQWERITGLERVRDAGYRGFRIQYRCMCCLSERLDTCDVYGRLDYRVYNMSDAFKEVARPDDSDSYTRVMMFRQAWFKTQPKE